MHEFSKHVSQVVKALPEGTEVYDDVVHGRDGVLTFRLVKNAFDQVLQIAWTPPNSIAKGTNS